MTSKCEARAQTCDLEKFKNREREGEGADEGPWDM